MAQTQKQPISPEAEVQLELQKRNHDESDVVGGVFGDADGKGFHNSEGKAVNRDGDLIDVDGNIVDTDQTTADAVAKIKAEAAEVIKSREAQLDAQADELNRLRQELADAKANKPLPAPVTPNTIPPGSLGSPGQPTPPGTPPGS